jgi:hypothetical protein
MENWGGALFGVAQGVLPSFLLAKAIPSVATRDIGIAAARLLAEGGSGKRVTARCGHVMRLEKLTARSATPSRFSGGSDEGALDVLDRARPRIRPRLLSPALAHRACERHVLQHLNGRTDCGSIRFDQ